jgi:hypothetical protein
MEISMANARDRLTHLVELASQSAPEKSRALAIELCDLLLDWPEDYSGVMRAPFESLMEKVARGLDGPTRRLLAARLAASGDTPVDLLNGFFFDVPAESKLAILARNARAAAGDEEFKFEPDFEPAFLASVRRDGAEFASALSEYLDIDAATASLILEDESSKSLAVACKGARLSRATYSSIAVLASGRIGEALEANYARLETFDDVPGEGAGRMLSYWRSRREAPLPEIPENTPTDLTAYASA